MCEISHTADVIRRSSCGFLHCPLTEYWNRKDPIELSLIRNGCTITHREALLLKQCCPEIKEEMTSSR